jgi:hypothetical protein
MLDRRPFGPYRLRYGAFLTFRISAALTSGGKFDFWIAAIVFSFRSAVIGYGRCALLLQPAIAGITAATAATNAVDLFNAVFISESS